MADETDQTIAAITRGLEGWYARLGRQFGPLSRPQRRVLLHLDDDSGLRVSDIAERLGMTTAGATRMVNALEAAGYVRRFRLPDADGREVRVALTPDGSRALQEAERAFHRRIEESLAALTPDDRATLARLLGDVAASPPPES